MKYFDPPNFEKIDVLHSKLKQDVRTFFHEARVDCILYPTTICQPFHLEEIRDGKVMHNGEWKDQLALSIQNTMLANYADLEALVIPSKGGFGMELCSPGERSNVIEIGDYLMKQLRDEQI